MEPWLVVGLGNPGPEYALTRHNVGVMAVEALAARWGGRLAAHKYTRCEVFEGRWAGRKVVLARGRSYMNESGGPVAVLADHFGVDPERVLLAHDELDIPFAALRIKQGGGDNGHNGLRSVRRSLGTGDTVRLRIGIGRPPGRQDPADFVLRPFSAAQREELPHVLERCGDAIECVIADGVATAQNRFNADPEAGDE
ncbi:MAG: aminoacyl-tRNA hydrolase [Actinomycetales bacterium]|nr:aminoacyl-tRNA hydrolase [Actinomycetales bacterium]